MLAVITYVSSDFLEVCYTFFSFYTSYHNIPANDIYVIRFLNNRVDKCLDQYNPTIIDTANKFDDRFKTSLLMTLQRKLLATYKFVLISDLDERFLPTPTMYRNIYEFLTHKQKTTTQPFIAAFGWEVLPASNPINWSRPLLMQRQQMARLCGMDKPVLSRVPLKYTFSTHSVVGFNAFSCGDRLHSDINLYNIHLKCIDLYLWKHKGVLDTDRKGDNITFYITQRCLRKQNYIKKIPKILKVL